MTAPATRLAYNDAFDAMNRALDDPTGIRIQVASKAEAYTLRSRLHYARRVDRSDNSHLDESDELYGRSVYDPLVVRIKQDVEEEWWVYIERATLNHTVIESLSENAP